MAHLPLEGIRVLDMTMAQQAPSSTMMLGEMGADVIKIERPGGEIGRDLIEGRARLAGDRNYYFEANNRNKRGIVLDLKKDEAREILCRLVEKSDVFVQNFRVGVAAKMGLGYEVLSKCNPKLIYASASAFGPEGPDAEKPGFDITGSARCGLMLAIGHPDWPPVYVRGVSDQTGAIMLTCSILAALLAREHTGIGQAVDTSLLGTMTFVQIGNVSRSLLQGEEFGRRNRKDQAMALQNTYKCGDGKWIVLAMSRDHLFWHDLCAALGVEGLETDPRFATSPDRKKNKGALIDRLDEIFATRPRAEWLERLGQYPDLVFTFVNNIMDLQKDPQILANKYIVETDHPVLGKIKQVRVPVRFSKMPTTIRKEAPSLGQHTEEVLTQILGYTSKQVADLKARKVVG